MRQRHPTDPFARFIASGQPPHHHARAVWNMRPPAVIAPALRNAPAQASRVAHIPLPATGRTIEMPLVRRDSGLRR
jgi:hypothetical protein